MSQPLYKGRTTNHITWAGVDATDFASPESALSAATKIKIYGKLRANDTVHFVSSGAGSLTNDIKHVGASALGLYTIGLVKADLSDASAAWYDQYIISLSATGAAYQTLICEGLIDPSNLSGVISDVYSALLLAQSLASDAHSVAAQVNSRVLLNQSRISDIASVLSDLQSDFQSRVPKRVATDSQLSNLISGVTSVDTSDMASAVLVELGSYLSDILSAAVQVNSRVLVAQSYLSDIRSHVSDLQSDFQSRVPKLVATNSQLSDLASDVKSAVAGITASVSASDISDIASAVRAALVSDLSDILSAAVQVNSRVLVAQSYLSDIRSHVSDLQSDFQSRVPKLVATNSQLSDLASDLKSAIGGITVTLGASDVSDIASAVLAGFAGTLTASDISDIASAVWANTLGAAVSSRVLLAKSSLSDIYSAVSDLQSDFQSRVPKRVATDSQLSDLHSDLKSHLTVSSGIQSDLYSLLSDLQSDFGSRVPKRVATDSQLSDLASDVKSAVGVGNSRILMAQSMASDLQSKLSDMESNLLSVLTTTGVGLNASALSDIGSVVAAAGIGITASDMSDIASRVDVVLGSRLSDILSAAQQVNSRVLVAQSVLSDVQSAVAVLPSAKLVAHAAAVLKVVIGSGSTTTSIVLDSSTGIDGGVPSATNDQYNGRVLIFTSGTLTGQATSISDYVGSSVTLTVVALTSAPSAGVTAVLV